LILPQLKPEVDQGEIANLPSFHFYMKIAAIKPEEPFSGETIPLKVSLNLEKVKRIVKSSHKLYAHSFKRLKDVMVKVPITKPGAIQFKVVP
jgi:hypothetical protein